MLKHYASLFAVIIAATIGMIITHGIDLAKAVDTTSMNIIVNNKTPSFFILGSQHISYGGWKGGNKPPQTMAPNSNSTWQAEITDGVPGFNGYAIYWLNGD